MSELYKGESKTNEKNEIVEAERALVAEYNTALKGDEKLKEEFQRRAQRVYYTEDTIKEVMRGNPFRDSMFFVAPHEHGKYLILKGPREKWFLFPNLNFDVNADTYDELRMSKIIFDFEIKQKHGGLHVLSVEKPAMFTSEGGRWKFDMKEKGEMHLEPDRE